MKKIIYFLSLAVITVLAISCEKEQEATSVEFSRSLYSLYAGGNVDVVVKLSEPAKADLIVDLNFGGTAVEGTNYEVASEEVAIKAGENSGTVTISAKTISGSEEIVITMGALPSGYKMGNKMTTIVSANAQSAIIYTFAVKQATVLETLKAQVKLSNISLDGEAPENFSATKKMTIPVILSGEGSDAVTVVGGGIVVEQGESEGYLELKLTDPKYSGNAVITAAVDRSEAEQLIPGNIEEVEIHVTGLLSPKMLEGTWKFKEVIDLEEVELWFSEMYDDPDLLPTHNAGFKLKFESTGEETGKLTPLGSGDWLKFFRETDFTYGSPINPTSTSIILGDHSAEEANMFIQEVAENPFYQNTYYKLSKANRAFSADTETIGEASIAMYMDYDGTLVVQFKDYDQPPFGEMWWDGFEPDMFSFASRFEKE